MTTSSKESFIAFVKKEYLLFKKEKNAKYKWFYDEIINILGSNSCLILEPDIIQAVNFKARYEGIGNVIHSDFRIVAEVELSGKHCGILNNICDYVVLDDEKWVLVFPSEWELCGGFLVDIGKLLSLLDEVSWVMDDDFIVYNKKLDSSLKVSGDRSGDNIATYNMTARGKDFISIVDALNNKL